MRIVSTVPDLLELSGTELGVSPWRTIAQEDIDAFAELTDDHQWIHVDPGRAVNGPYGTTIAHGMLTLSFVPVFVGEVLRVDNAAFSLNYGFERIRFVSPVPSGSCVRGRVSVSRTEPVEGDVRVSLAVTVEVDGSERPSCVAEQVIVWIE